MNIALVNHQGLKTVSGIQVQTPAPSIGLAYLGAFLKSNGFDYVAVDACGEGLDQIRAYPDRENVVVQGLTNPEVLARIPRESEVIGFTCLFSHCWPLVIDLARAVREKFPSAFLVVGGEHPTAMPELSLANGIFDAAILGEGEETFLELVRKLEAQEDWRDTLGIAYLNEVNEFVRNKARARVTQIDEFPFPDWDAWSIENYIEHQQVTGVNLGRSIPILGSRGCPYACTFCSNPEMWTRRYIFRDPKRLVDEMEFFKEKYRLDGFSFMDLTFIVNRKKVLAFANELTERKLNVSYQLPAGTRCEAIDEQLAFALEASGLRNFALAPESGDEEILSAIKKQIKMPRFYEAVDHVLKTDMVVGCFIVIGFPEDTKDSLKSTLRMVRRLALAGVHDVTVSQFTPYPGSEYFHRLEQAGKVGGNFEDLAQIIDFYSQSNASYSDRLSAAEIHRWMIWMYLNFYIISFVCRPWRVLYNFWIYWLKGIERARYMRFFSEFFVNRKHWKTPLP